MNNKIEMEKRTMEARIRFIKEYGMDWWELVLIKSIKPSHKKLVAIDFLNNSNNQAK